MHKVERREWEGERDGGGVAGSSIMILSKACCQLAKVYWIVYNHCIWCAESSNGFKF